MKKNFIKEIFFKRESILLIIIIIIYLLVFNFSKYFKTTGNISALLSVISINSIIVAGMTLLFISGGFDISVGTHMTFLGIILGVLLGNDVSVFYSIIIVLILSAIDGLIIGLIITKLKVSPFITTLGAMFIFGGLAFFIGSKSKVGNTMAATISNFPESFRRISTSTFFKIEYINFYALIIIVILIILLRNNIFLRQNFYLGSNVNYSRLAGIKVNILTIFNYILLSILVAIAAILKASRLGSVSAMGGAVESFGLLIIGAVIIGGASLRGGSGSIIGGILGVVLLALIDNSVIMLNISPYYSDIIVGIILLFAIIADRFIRRNSLQT